MQNDVDLYAGGGPGTLSNGRRYTSILYTHPTKHWFNRERWGIHHRSSSKSRSPTISGHESLIAHRCGILRAIPWGEGYTFAYTVIPGMSCPEVCWRCHSPIPPEVVGLWKMQNWDTKEL